MSSDLRDRLADLAEQTAPAASPTDLWDRGVRRRRLAHAGSAALVAVLVLLLGAGGLAWNSERRVEPAAPHGRATLPDRFYAPSPWLKTFDGAPGPLVAIIPAEHSSLLRSHEGVVGVTAEGNTYGFLDLPSSAIARSDMTGGLALSPGGTRVAFWVTGSTSGAPNTDMEAGVTVVGLGTYDTVTGKTRVHPVPSAHGIQPSLLIWTDDSTLVFGYGRILDDGSGGGSRSRYAGTAVWDADEARPVMLPPATVPPYPDAGSSDAARGVLLTPGPGSDWLTVDPRVPDSVRRFPLEGSACGPVLSGDLRRVAGVESESQGDYGWLSVARIPATASPSAASGRFRQSPAGRQWWSTVAWTPDGRVVALRRLPDVGPTTTGEVMAELDRVDPRTGSYTKLASVERGANVANGFNSLLATWYLGAPVAHASPPPTRWNPRWFLLLGAGFAAAGLLLWRRHGRRA